MRESFPHPETPPKRKTAADGYQTRSVGDLMKTPSEREGRITGAASRNRGAEDISSSPIKGGVVYDDSGA